MCFSMAHNFFFCTFIFTGEFDVIPGKTKESARRLKFTSFLKNSFECLLSISFFFFSLVLFKEKMIKGLKGVVRTIRIFVYVFYLTHP